MLNHPPKMKILSILAKLLKNRNLTFQSVFLIKSLTNETYPNSGAKHDRDKKLQPNVNINGEK